MAKWCRFIAFDMAELLTVRIRGVSEKGKRMKFRDIDGQIIFYRTAAVALRRAGSHAEADAYGREADRLTEAQRQAGGR